jgi:hypothetical protein
LSEVKNKAPDFPSSDYIRNLERALENFSCFKRRVFLYKRVVSNYPHFFYRYISLDPTDDNSIKKLRDVIVNSSLWLSSRDGFNDPFDLKAKYIIEGRTLKFRNKIKELLKKHYLELGGVKRTKEINRIMANQPELLKNLNNSMTKSLEEIGACCFTIDPRNLLMWSHYANNHRGIVLQFEVANDTSTFLKNVRVEYVNDYPLLNWANETESEIRKSFLNKFKTWEYEKEWRMVHIFGANSYINFKPEALTGLIFGSKADSNIKEAVDKLLAERTKNNMPTVNTYNAYMHDSKYKLIIKK